ncbi:CASP C terminal-domain-containing protein [Usnea florida]
MDISAGGDTASPYESDRDGPRDTLNSTNKASSTLSRNGDSLYSEEDNKFQTAISAWRNIDLTKLVPELDSTATDIVTHQRDALLSRKDLAQKTKDFRKLDDAAKLGEFKGLLKAYQTFIDLLTSHGKTTSSAFLQIYSSVSEAPDPYPLLEASVDALLLSEDTLPKLTSENEHLQKSISNLTQQLDNSDRLLEEERTARRALEESRDTRIKEVESSWKAVVEEKKDNWEAKERSLEDKIESQERLLNELKASYEVSQRLGQGGGDENEAHRNSASAAELELVSSELDRTSQRLADVEARNEQLRVELAETSSSTQRKSTADEDPNLARLRSENSTLLRRLDNVRLEKDTETRKRETRIRALEKNAQMLERDREGLRERVQSWRDYDEIKQELEIFKSIELSTLDDDDAPAGSTGDLVSANGTATGDKKDSLEQLLLARNKKLGNEMAVLRISHQDLQQQLETMQETMSNTNSELERAQNLNATLETDLVKVQQEASNAFPSSAMSVAGTYSSRYPSSTYNANSFPSRKGRVSPTSSIISGFDPQSAQRNTLDAIRAGEPVGGGSGIMPMVQAQRDRFKQKNTQLEEELSKQYGFVSSLRQEIASLQKDNLNLYEKSRYVSTYSRGAPASSASAYAQSPHPTAISASAETPSGLSLDRYRSTYEANLSPFAAFRGRESTRAYKRMSLPERVVFSITRMVLANRTSRNLFAFYCFSLHILIFVMLYWMHSFDVSKHASNLSEAVNVVAAGGGNPGADAQHGDWLQEGFEAGAGT